MADTVVVGKSVVRTDAAAKARGGAMYGVDDWGLDKPMPKEESLSVPIEDLAHDRFIVGNAEECRDGVERHARTLGVNHFIFRVQWPGMPQGDALGQIAQLGREVVQRT